MHAPDGLFFLGYSFECDRRTPRRKSVAMLKDALRLETRRTKRRSLTHLQQHCARFESGVLVLQALTSLGEGGAAKV
jgi:hypothetical protein